MQRIIWQRWACGALPVVLYFPGQSRSPHAIRAWPARTAFRMPRSNELLLHQVAVLQLRSIVIFDNLVVLVAGFSGFFRTNCILLCNTSDRCI